MRRRIGCGPKSIRAKTVSKIRRTKEQAYTVNWPAISAAVKKRDGCRCCLCGATNYLQVDHIVPVSKGGQTIMTNLWTLCDICHSKRPGHSKAKHLILHKRNKEKRL